MQRITHVQSETDHHSTEQGSGLNKQNLRKCVRRFLSHIQNTKTKQELLGSLTTLLYDFNRARFNIREKQLKIWVDYILSCQHLHQSKGDIVKNCKAIESQYLFLQRKQSTIGVVFMSAFHVTLDAVSQAHSHFEAIDRVKLGMGSILEMCKDM